MSKNIIKTAIICGGALFVVACSGGGKGKFVSACTGAMTNDLGSAEDAKVACNCAHERLSEELSSKQLSMAADIVSLKDETDIEAYGQKNKGAILVSERIEGALKSCAGSGF